MPNLPSFARAVRGLASSDVHERNRSCQWIQRYWQSTQTRLLKSPRLKLLWTDMLIDRASDNLMRLHVGYAPMNDAHEERFCEGWLLSEIDEYTETIPWEYKEGWIERDRICFIIRERPRRRRRR